MVRKGSVGTRFCSGCNKNIEQEVVLIECNEKKIDFDFVCFNLTLVCPKCRTNNIIEYKEPYTEGIETMKQATKEKVKANE